VKNLKQKHRIKLPDAIIAATAVYLDIPLITFDSDFDKIDDIKLILLKL
jgi:predicted nucleic acid-binding protein